MPRRCAASFQECTRQPRRGDGPKPPRRGCAILSRCNTTTFSVWPRPHTPLASTVNSPSFIRPFRAGDGSIVIGSDAKSNLAIALINNPDRRWGIVIGVLVNHGAKSSICRYRRCKHGQSRGQKQRSHFHHIPFSAFRCRCILPHVHRPCQTVSRLLVIDKTDNIISLGLRGHNQISVGLPHWQGSNHGALNTTSAQI